MGWVAIIAAIIQAIPTVIKLIEMLRDLMKDRTVAERRVVSGELRGVMKRWRSHRDSKRAADEIAAVIHRARGE